MFLFLGLLFALVLPALTNYIDSRFCWQCRHFGRVSWGSWQSSRTEYHWDGKGSDPNAPVMLCEECAAEHHAHWDEMWSEARYDKY
ncbi:hypothetical protein KAU11_03895 [Candidatus Babeliales bacterium]|nr:hypothetical protein [Candidatus Babeliales bacterium]